MINSYVGLDPSFTGYGISIIDEEIKKVSFFETSYPIDKKSTLRKFDAIEIISHAVSKILRKNTSDKIFIGQEVSTAYTGWFIAELYALDFETYRKNIESLLPAHYDLFSQTYITFITGHKSSLKEQTIFILEDKILPIFVTNGYEVYKDTTTMTKTDVKEKNRYIKRETITNNEADAFIYALREFIKYSNDNKTKNEILQVLPKLLEDSKELK
jgi:hypothetical protein